MIVQTIDNIENGLLLVVLLGVLALQLWALVDCITRKAPAFPAAGKLTKPTWILLTAVAVAPVAFLQDVLNLLSYIGIIVGCGLLADVRPAVRRSATVPLVAGPGL